MKLKQTALILYPSPYKAGMIITPPLFSRPDKWLYPFGRVRVGWGVRLLFLFIYFSYTMDAQPPPPAPEQLLLGRQSFSGLMGMKDYSWFDTNVALAKADTANNQTCLAIAAIIQPYKIVVVGGTWCSDTQDLLPKFFVALQRAKIEPDKLTELYFVNRTKNEPQDIATKYAVTNVPIFIVYDKNGKEVGRIVESVKISIADDLLAILKKLE